MYISKKKLFSFSLVLLWMLMMFGLSSSVGSSHNTHYLLTASIQNLSRILPLSVSPYTVDTMNWIVRKSAHFCEYGILMGLLYWFSTRNFSIKPTKALLLAFLSVTLFAITDEFHQSFVPGRTSLFTDVMIDLSGAAMSALLLWCVDIRQLVPFQDS